MHRLTQRVLLDQMRRERRLRDAASSAVATLTLVIDNASNPLTEIPTDVVDHISTVWTLAQRVLAGDSPDEEPLASLLRLRRWCVSRLTTAGELSRAVSLGLESLAEHESLLPAAHQFIGEARRALQSAYITADRWDAAIALAEQTLADRIRLFGPDDERTIGARNSVGYCCECGGRLDRAAPFSGHLGHVHTATCLDGLLGVAIAP
jgi:hypothetical protein